MRGKAGHRSIPNITNLQRGLQNIVKMDKRPGKLFLRNYLTESGLLCRIFAGFSTFAVRPNFTFKSDEGENEGKTRSEGFLFSAMAAVPGSVETLWAIARAGVARVLKDK